jgi:hypothetical protein
MVLASTYDQSRFLNAGDITGEKKMRIKNVTEEKMMDGEVKLTVWFTNDKRGLPLNKTNNRASRGAFGDETDGWKDKIIVLFTVMTDIRGQVKPGIRVRILPPKGDGRAVAQPAKPAAKPVAKPAPKPVERPIVDENLDAEMSLEEELNDEIDF